MKKIPYSRQSVNEADIEAVCSVLRSDWLTQGPKAREFEDALADVCKAKHCILVSNGTVALYMACQVLDIRAGDAGLTSPLSFSASANCIVYCDGRPDFVDIDPTTLCLSPDKVEEYCENNQTPKVVIPVDFGGVPADLPRLKKLSERFGFKLIEDAAHSIGSKYEFEGKDYACGSCAHSDIAIFSFHPVKTITTGEGGALMTNDGSLADKLRKIANHGIERDPKNFQKPLSIFRDASSPPPWYYEMQDMGLNARITDFQCALGISQLGRLEEFKSKKQKIVREYNQAFRELEKKNIVILPPWPEAADPCYHLYPIRLGNNCKISRDDLFQKLRERRINCQVHYIPIYRQPFYEKHYTYKPERFPETEKYFASCLSLPLFPEMDDISFHHVVETFSSLVGAGDNVV